MLSHRRVTTPSHVHTQSAVPEYLYTLRKEFAFWYRGKLSKIQNAEMSPSVTYMREYVIVANLAASKKDQRTGIGQLTELILIAHDNYIYTFIIFRPFFLLSLY